MYSFLLKKALPFALTFIFGAALSALLGLFGSGRTNCEVRQVRQFHLEEYGRGRRECRMRRHDLVAESKPLKILGTPLAPLSKVSPEIGDLNPVTVNVTFGASGKVEKVEPAVGAVVRQEVWEAVENAARMIQFEPETVNGLPVTVTREVEIQPWRCANSLIHAQR